MCTKIRGATTELRALQIYKLLKNNKNKSKKKA